MTERQKLTQKILQSKRRLGLTWATISVALGSHSEIVYTAALLGQSPLTHEEAHTAAALLELDESDALLLSAPPNRGAGVQMPPADPLIYRFYELVQNYGETWKELIHEKFGDGIMSAIDFNMSIDREPNPAGDRVRIAMSGKFLPYRRF